MRDTNKKSLLQEIRESECRQASANPLTGLMQELLECKDSQEASSALARALSLQGRGDPGLPRTGYLANPASLIGIPRLEPVHAGNKISFGSSALTALAQALVQIDLANES